MIDYECKNCKRTFSQKNTGRRKIYCEACMGNMALIQYEKRKVYNKIRRKRGLEK